MRQGWIVATAVMFFGAMPVGAEDWGAVFRDVKNGYVGHSWKFQDAASAEERALRECRRGGKDCFFLFAVHGRSVCTAHATNDDNKDVYIAEGSSEADASAKALAACKEGGSHDCSVDQALCADRRPRE